MFAALYPYQKSSIEFAEDHLVIKYATRKNDQLYSGNQKILKYRGDLLCPKLIFETYFKLMKLEHDDVLLNYRISLNGKTARSRA